MSRSLCGREGRGNFVVVRKRSCRPPPAPVFQPADDFVPVAIPTLPLKSFRRFMLSERRPLSLTTHESCFTLPPTPPGQAAGGNPFDMFC